MPTAKIPIAAKVLRDADEAALKDNQVFIFDAYIDELGALNKRPGSNLWKDLGLGVGAKIQGVFWWQQRQIAIAVANGNIYKLTYPSGVPTVTNLSGVTIDPTAPVSFATDGTYVFLANGSRISYTDGTSLAAFIADAGAPLNATHLGYLDGYLIALKGDSNQFVWSNVNDSLTWSALSFASAAGSPDYIRAMHIANREIYLFGVDTIEIWENDGSTPFSRVPGGYAEWGVGSKHGVARLHDTFFWLDKYRRVISMTGRQPEIVDTAFDTSLQDLSTVEDCRAYPLEIAGRMFVIFDFPTDQRTIILDPQLEQTYEWGSWNSTTSEYELLPFIFPISCPDWGIYLAGNRDDSNILTLSTEAFSDYSGREIRPAIRTGFMDHGTSKRKRSEEIRFRLKRGAVDVGSDAKMIIRWRNDDSLAWGNEVEISLGDLGERELYHRIFRTGMFRSRQYEVYVTDSVPVVIVEAEHDLTFLER